MAVVSAKQCGIASVLTLSVAVMSAQAQSLETQKVRLPGSNYEIVVAPGGPPRHPAPPAPSLVRALGAWLSFSFGLPAVAEQPSFRLAPVQVMIALRASGVGTDPHSPTTVGAASTEQPDIVALYDTGSMTIYLREDWTGASAAELSVVVHELVHHMQQMAGLRFPCNEAREELAFAAQERWLGFFGKNLETEFGLDPFTLLVRTHCPI